MSDSTSGLAPEQPGSPAPRRRGLPTWLLAVVGVLVVGLVVVAVLVLSNRTSPAVAPGPAAAAQTVTLAAPQPTVKPIARDAGTTFFDALPSTVLSYALSQAGPAVPLVTAGALEGYQMAYTDGGSSTLTLSAGQWPTAQAAAAAYTGLVAARPAAGAVEEGAVQVGGTEVGRFTIAPRADGTGTLTWSNGTAVMQVDGPAAALRDFYAAFPL